MQTARTHQSAQDARCWTGPEVGVSMGAKGWRRARGGLSPGGVKGLAHARRDEWLDLTSEVLDAIALCEKRHLTFPAFVAILMAISRVNLLPT